MYRTRQEIFDLAYIGMTKQNWVRSYNNYDHAPSVAAGGCQYRGPNGTKCAIGHCIPDELYEPTLEGQVPTDDAVMKAAGISPDDKDWAESLQDCHDGSPKPDLMKAKFDSFAVEHGLTIPEIKD